jgi:hypothetical protein
MRPGINWVGDDKVFIMPDFIHEIGDRFHHMSIMRTVELDEEGDFIPGTGPKEWRFKLHEFLDAWFFYPLRDLVEKKHKDSDVYQRFRTILGFFWGLNCGFPFPDVVRYTLWDWRGCPALAVFKRIEGTWTRTK